MKSTLFYKLLAGLLATLLVVGGVYAGKTIQETQLEVDHVRNDEEKVKSLLDHQKSELDTYQEFLKRLQNDPSFLEYVARERLNYAKPDEYIYRFDADQLTSAPTGNLDSAQPPTNAPSSNTGQSLPGTLHH